MSGLLKFITCGSVDDGKSTLIGHILYDSKLLYADQEKALVLDSKVGSRGGEIDYSLLLDGLMAEREQGITIDVAYRYFTTDHRSFIVADTPGHEEYTRNMAVGASFAQLAIVMVDAKQGVLVQTRRHARICALMGIRYFVFAVNKMDLVDYSEKRFQEIQKEIEELAASLNLYSVKVIPVSATAGDNVTKTSENTPWYEGESLLTYLEQVEVSEQEKDDIFYLPVQRVCRPNHEFRGFQGQAESGQISVGDKIITLPSNEEATVKSILTGDKKIETGFAGQALTIQLDKEVDVSRGCVLTTSQKPVVYREVDATILWMDDEKLTTGKEYLVKLGTRKIPGVVKSIEYKIDVNTGQHMEVSAIEKNEIASCKIVFSEKVVVDEFQNNKTLGEFILIDRVSHMTSACGVVDHISNDEDKPYFENGDLKSPGSIFENLFYDIDNTNISGNQEAKKTYHVGDAVPVQDESFEYPDYFDILSTKGSLVVLVRDKKIEDIISLADYQYIGLPILDERGFEIKIKSKADVDLFVAEYEKMNPEKSADFVNKWAKFETYRRVVCTNGFWMI